MLSVIVPAHNEETELPRTLRALRESLARIDEPSEVVVVDDASTDGTARIARSAGAAVVRSSARQIAAARNAGSRAARGDWLLFVDADTRVSPAALQAAVTALRQGAVGGGAEVRWEPPVPWWGRASLWTFMLVWRRLGYAAGCFLFARRADFETVGGFDEGFYVSEEIWLSRALRARGRFVIVSDAVLTSGRKVRMNSPLGVIGLSLRLLIEGPRGWRRRERVDLWYDGRREPGGGFPGASAAAPGNGRRMTGERVEAR